MKERFYGDFMRVYDILKNHIGHKITCVVYGNEDSPDDICIECEDCNEVLISSESFDGETEE